MAKSDKLYEASPSIKKNEEGKAGISKPTKADKTDMGLEDNASEMPINVHQEMHERHLSELKDMHKRHAKEMESKFAPKSDEDTTEGQE